MSLDVADLTASHDGDVVWRNLGFHVPTASILAIRGPSGRGKTTLLRCVAGLHRADSGRIAIDGVDVTNVPTHRRSVGLVFQDDQLFPHLDVFENVAFGLRVARRDRDEIRRRVDDLLALVGLGELSRRAVDRLSGGEAKRVALARSLATEPRVLLLDEPFGGLDAERRLSLGADIRRIVAETRTTALLVSHDRDDVANVADATFELPAAPETTPDRRPVDRP